MSRNRTKKARKHGKNRFPGKTLWDSAQFGVAVSDHRRLCLAVDGIGGDDYRMDAVVRGGLEHDVGHDALHDGAQAAGAGVQLEGLFGNSLQSTILDRKSVV